MIVVFPVGKPLLCFYLLWRKRGKLDVGQGDGEAALEEAVAAREKNEGIKHLAFLYESYQPKYVSRPKPPCACATHLSSTGTGGTRCSRLTAGSCSREVSGCSKGGVGSSTRWGCWSAPSGCDRWP